MNSKYSNILTILLVVIILAIIGIIGFLGYKYYETNTSKTSSEDFVDSFESNLESNKPNTDKTEGDDLFTGVDEGTSSGNDNSSSDGNASQSTAPKYNGFTTAGTIEIPATGLKGPIIAQEEYSKSALESAVVELYGNGLNQVGNTTIVGHNYRDGRFFANNKKLNIGDKIYITDLTGQRLSYTIYNKYEATDTESDYMTRDTQGAIEISLSTCTDDTKGRLVIWAKADV